MQPRTDLAAAASLPPLAGCTQLEAISSDREKAGHRWQRRHRTRPVRRRRHPADLPRVVRRRGAARRSRRPRGPLRARRGVRSDRGRRRRRRRRAPTRRSRRRTSSATRGRCSPAPSPSSSPSSRSRGSTTGARSRTSPRSSTGWRRSKRWRFRPASRGSSRPTTSTSSGCWSSAWGPVCRRKLTNRVPPGPRTRGDLRRPRGAGARVRSGDDDGRRTRRDRRALWRPRILPLRDPAVLPAEQAECLGA